jgi:hypothetical protein
MLEVESGGLFFFFVCVISLIFITELLSWL